MLRINLARVITNPMFHDPTCLTIRRSKGGYVDGLWKTYAQNDFQLKPVSIQPAEPKSVNLLPEGKRTREAFQFCTTELVRGANDCDQSDFIIGYRIKDWEVSWVERWDAFAGYFVLITALTRRLEDGG